MTGIATREKSKKHLAKQVLCKVQVLWWKTHFSPNAKHNKKKCGGNHRTRSEGNTFGHNRRGTADAQTNHCGFHDSATSEGAKNIHKLKAHPRNPKEKN